MLLNIYSALLCLIPALLVTGPFLPDLTLSLSGVITIYYIIHLNLWKRLKYNIIILFILFNIYLVVRSYLSFIDPLKSLESSLFYFRFFVYCLGIVIISEIDKNFFKKYKLIINLTIIILIIDTYFQFFVGFNLLGYENNKSDYHQTSFFKDEQVLGSFLSKILPVFIAINYLNKNDSTNFKKNIAFSILVLFIFGAIVVSGERAALFKTIMFLGLFVLFFNQLISTKNKLYLFLCAFIFMTLILTFSKKTRIRIIFHTLDYNFNIIDKSDGYSFNFDNIIFNSPSQYKFISEQHTSHYKTAISIFNNNKIFGIGPKLFRVVCKEKKYIHFNGCSTHPHNFYLQIASDTGIVGLLFLLSMFTYIVYKLYIIFINQIYDKKNYTIFYKSIILGCFINIWPLGPNGNFFGNWNSILIYLSLSLFIYILLNDEKKFYQ